MPTHSGTQLEKPISLWQHPEYRGGTSLTRGKKEIGKEAGKNIKGIKMMQLMLDAFRKSAGSLPMNLCKNLIQGCPSRYPPTKVSNSNPYLPPLCSWLFVLTQECSNKSQSYKPNTIRKTNKQTKSVGKGETTSLSCNTTFWKTKRFLAIGLLNCKNQRLKSLINLPKDGAGSVEQVYPYKVRKKLM